MWTWWTPCTINQEFLYTSQACAVCPAGLIIVLCEEFCLYVRQSRIVPRLFIQRSIPHKNVWEWDHGHHSYKTMIMSGYSHWSRWKILMPWTRCIQHRKRCCMLQKHVSLSAVPCMTQGKEKDISGRCPEQSWRDQADWEVHMFPCTMQYVIVMTPLRGQYQVYRVH